MDGAKVRDLVSDRSQDGVVGKQVVDVEGHVRPTLGGLCEDR